MKAPIRSFVLALASVVGVSASIAVMQAAGIAFPPALHLSAWPEWIIFAALVHAIASMAMFFAALGRPSRAAGAGGD